LAVLKEVVDDVFAEGIAKEHIDFLGFSQGACLTLGIRHQECGKIWWHYSVYQLFDSPYH